MASDNNGRIVRYTRSGNPGLNDRTFSALPRPALADERMTLQGTVNKSFLLLVVLMGCALYPWSQYMSGNTAVVGPSMLIGIIAGLVLALIISFKATLAPYLSVPYAACQGLAMGALSAVFELRIRNPHSDAEWTRLVEELIAVNGGGDVYVYLHVSRGAEYGRNHAPLPDVAPTIFGFCAPLPANTAEVLEQGMRCITAQDTRWARCDIKS